MLEKKDESKMGGEIGRMMVRGNSCVKQDLPNTALRKKNRPIDVGRLFSHSNLPYFCSAFFAAHRRFAASDILRLAAALTL